jgi:hypothetical protein
LQPITAKLAYGHLKPGHLKPGSRTAHTHQRKLPKAAMDAMASANNADTPRAYSAPAPMELHRVY